MSTRPFPVHLVTLSTYSLHAAPYIGGCPGMQKKQGGRPGESVRGNVLHPPPQGRTILRPLSTLKSTQGLQLNSAPSAAVAQLHDGPGELRREFSSMEWTLAADLDLTSVMSS